MSKIFIVGLVVVVAVVAGYMLVQRNSNQSANLSDMKAEASVSPSVSPEMPAVSIGVSAEPAGTTSPTPMAEVKSFTVNGKSFSFSPSEIKVKKGDTVKITFKDTDGFHDLVIDEFNARTSRINGGEAAEMTFVADKTGKFEYYCSVGSHRAKGMTGTLIVE